MYMYMYIQCIHVHIPLHIHIHVIQWGSEANKTRNTWALSLKVSPRIILISLYMRMTVNFIDTTASVFVYLLLYTLLIKTIIIKIKIIIKIIIFIIIIFKIICSKHPKFRCSRDVAIWIEQFEWYWRSKVFLRCSCF